MEVRYMGDFYKGIFDKSKSYVVDSVEEGGAYTIYIEAFDDYFLFDPREFVVLDEIK